MVSRKNEADYPVRHIADDSDNPMGNTLPFLPSGYKQFNEHVPSIDTIAMLHCKGAASAIDLIDQPPCAAAIFLLTWDTDADDSPGYFDAKTNHLCGTTISAFHDRSLSHAPKVVDYALQMTVQIQQHLQAEDPSHVAMNFAMTDTNGRWMHNSVVIDSDTMLPVMTAGLAEYPQLAGELWFPFSLAWLSHMRAYNHIVNPTLANNDT